MKSHFTPLQAQAGQHLLAVLVAGLLCGATTLAAEKPPAATIAVEAMAVRATTVAREVSAVGTVRSNESIILTTEVAGLIEAINFSEGTRVTKGTVLVKLDQAVAAAERDRAAASLALSEANYQRSETLFKDEAISQRERDEALAQFRLDQAQLRLREAQLDKTVLRAPFTGVVGLRNVSVGGYAQPGSAIATLDAVDPVKIDFRIPESYSGQVKLGQKLEVTVDALPQRIFRGTIYAIDPQIDDQGRSQMLRGRVKNADNALRPGMFATVKLALGDQAQALLVPEEAIISQGGKQLVYKVVAGQAVAAVIKTGLRRKGEVEIVSGLNEGEMVIIAGQLKVRPGTPVTIVPATR